MLQRFLYLSRLAHDQNSDTATEILRQSHPRNLADGITGALVFDGQRFCQLIEGQPAVVRELAARIAIDARHSDMTVMFDAIDDTPQHFSRWDSIFCAATDLDPFDVRGAIGPQQALATFMALLARHNTAQVANTVTHGCLSG